MAQTVLIKGGTLLTMNARGDIVEGDLLVRDGHDRGGRRARRRRGHHD